VLPAWCRSLSLILADNLPWSQVFAITAAFMLPGLIKTLSVSEPARSRRCRAPCARRWWSPSTNSSRGARGLGAAGAGLHLPLQAGDSLCTALATPFYWTWLFQERDRRDRQERRAVAGGDRAHAGGLWMVRLASTAPCGCSAWCSWRPSSASPGWLAGAAPSDPARLSALALVIGFEALGVGLGTAAFVATSHAPPPSYTATQLALFHQPGGGAATFINASAGWFDALGWFDFFLMCAVAGGAGHAAPVRCALERRHG